MPSLDLDADDRDDNQAPNNPSAVTPRRVLVEALLDAAGPIALDAALAGDVPVVIIVEACSADLAKLVSHELSHGRRQARVVAVTATKKNGDDECIEQMLTSLSSRVHFVVVTQDPAALLPGLVRIAADLVIRLPRPDAAIMRRAIARLTGKTPASSLRNLALEKVDVPGLLTVLRPGSTPGQCLVRLKSLCATVLTSAGTTTGPTIEELPLVDPVRNWADELLAQMRGIDAGEVPPTSLRHAVLEGPPGTGKTLIAHALSRSSGWPMHATSIGDWFATSDGNLGGVSRACRAFFDSLLSQEKAIGFIDEIDALPDRSQLAPKDLQWWGTCITLVLSEIDRVRRSGKPILLVAATNFYGRLDRALTRHERMEQQVRVYPPRTEAEIGAVFRYHLNGALDENTISTVARLCVGTTPAAISSTVEEARAIARKGRRPLIPEDLIAAACPIDRRPPAELRKIAIHEAGHVVVAHLLGFSTASVSIIASGPMGGVTRMRDLPSAPDRSELEALVMMHLGGRAADIAVGKGAHAGAAEDLETVTHLISQGICRLGLYGTLTQLDAASSDLATEIEGHLKRLLQRTIGLIKANAMVVTALADALLARRILNESEISQILEASLEQLARRKRVSKSKSVIDANLGERRNG
jgi:cell division protease FtsH